MGKAKGGKKGRKIGRNKSKCSLYQTANMRIKNKASRLARKVEKGKLSTNGMKPELISMINKRIERRIQIRKEILHHVNLIKKGESKIIKVPEKIRARVSDWIKSHTV